MAPTTVAATAPTKPAPTATSTPEPQLLKIGDMLESQNWHMMVTSVERVDGELVWSRFGNKSTAAGQWLVVTLEITNTGQDSRTLTTRDFELRTATGQMIKHITDGIWIGYAQYTDRTALGRPIPPGTKVTTPLLFDIPKDLQGLDLILTQEQHKPINVG